MRTTTRRERRSEKTENRRPEPVVRLRRRFRERPREREPAVPVSDRRSVRFSSGLRHEPSCFAMFDDDVISPVGFTAATATVFT
ncbi:hypothetical protein Hdeb2414_s0011g00368011 [Helianthus debilis subsp. tardiflorus]